MSTWETQELPVLRALTAHFAIAGARSLAASDIAERTGLDERVVTAVLRRLSEAKPPYVLGLQRLQGASGQVVTGVTERTLHELEQDDINAKLATRAEEVPQRRQPLPPGALRR